MLNPANALITPRLRGEFAKTCRKNEAAALRKPAYRNVLGGNASDALLNMYVEMKSDAP